MLVDTFSGWIEAFPVRTETAAEVVKALLKEIIPRSGLPGSLQSDNGPAFVSEVTKGIMSALGKEWTFHSVTGERREIPPDPEMGLSQAMSGNSRKLD